MNPDFWHARWQRGEIGWHEDEVNLHLQEHWTRLKATRGTRVFVPLCGKALDLLWLAGEGHPVLGVEISHLAVEAFFADNRLAPEVTEEPLYVRYRAAEVEILCGDFFDLGVDHLREVGAVYDRASLIAMPPELRPGYAGHLSRLLPTAAPILLITLEYDPAEMSGPPFSVQEDEVHDLFASRFDIEQVVRTEALASNERLRQRGLTHLREQVYVLREAR